jgi:formylglycine-generating enzyme required for sulfatase activity
MNTNLVTILKGSIADYDEGTLADPRRLKAFFSGLTKDEPKPLRTAFGLCIEAGAYNALKTAPDAAERVSRKGKIAEMVRADHGQDRTLCTEVLDILEAALYGTASTAPKAASVSQAAPPPKPQITLSSDSTKWKPITDLISMLTVNKKAVVCPTCGTGLPQGFRFCPACGAAVASGGVAPQARPSQQRAAPAGFIRIEGGTFQMGSDNGSSDERPVHQVTVQSFYMGIYAVTQKEWAKVMGSNPSKFHGVDLPVEQVDWYEAIEYCNRRSKKEGLTPAYQGNMDSIRCNFRANGYRLPTEAEWEYAANGGNHAGLLYEYSGSNSVDAVGWYNGNSRGKTHAVGRKRPNAWACTT